jgi:mono/diheme cytochrome c family protein
MQTLRKRWLRYGLLKRCSAVTMLAAGLLLLIFSIRIAIELIAYYPDSFPTNGLESSQNASASPVDAQLVERGRYLAILGNCAACHTARGGAAFAGSKAIHTPFGAVFASNITPHPQQGIGSWSADAFYRALHRGVSANGKLLTPAFPYTSYTQVSRADSDALYAYFMQAVSPVAQANQAHELRWPFNTQLALAVWRVLFFSANSDNATNSIAETQDFIPTNGLISSQNTSGQTISQVSPQLLARGRYLVQGLGHCSACHAERNALGAEKSSALSGALMPMQDWYAPSLQAREEAGSQHLPRAQVVALLKNGVAAHGSALGPMSEVVAKSTQQWRDADLQAAVAYLQSLPVQAAPRKTSHVEEGLRLSLQKQGVQLYAQHCATCHGDNGQGLQLEGQVALPTLAGNRAVTMASSANLVRIILAGGYAPSTAGNPRPYGMPPFVHMLTDEQIAAVSTYIRSAWGNQAAAVSATEVVTQRSGVLR